MELIRGLHNLHPRHRGCIATIGNFDGVHLGHQAVLGQLADKSAELRLPTIVITFEPQPEEYFGHGEAPPRLTRLREKLKALHRYAVERVLCLSFDRDLATTEAELFIRSVLVEGLGVRYLVVGDDFRFGNGRRGNFSMLQLMGVESGFEVAAMHTFEICGDRVSSTRIREALQGGNMALAEQLLGRPYRMCGRVSHGAGLGYKIGFPTANIFLHRRKTPVNGVFAVEMFGISGEPLPGVANVGNRPTVDGANLLLEVHLLDFSADLYGHYVHVDFLRRLRTERQFNGLPELQRQIATDVEQAREIFSSRDR